MTVDISCQPIRSENAGKWTLAPSQNGTANDLPSHSHCIIMPLLTLSSIAQMRDLSRRFGCSTFWQPSVQSELSFSGSQISLHSTVSPLASPFFEKDSSGNVWGE
jgi:hypothetical protein